MLRSQINIFISLFFVLAEASFSIANAQSKEVVINRFITAIGGAEKWLAIMSRIDSGYVVEFSRFRMPDSSFTKTIIVEGNKQKFILYEKKDKSLGSLKYQKSINCYNGNYLWLMQNDRVSKMNSEDSEAYKNTITFGLPDIFLKDKNAEIEYMGRLDLNGQPYEVLKVKGSNQYFYQLLYFDIKTGLLSCSVGYDTPVKRFSYSKEYKWFGGLLRSTYGEDYIDGELKSIGRTISLKYNEIIDSKIFNENAN